MASLEQLFEVALTEGGSRGAGEETDPELRRELDDLLAAFDQAEQTLFLSKPIDVDDVLSSEAPATPLQLEMVRRIGRFEILEPVGSGGMAVVYRARETGIGRDVAVKLLRGGLLFDPGQAKRFETEARSLAKLQHPGIVHLYEFGEFEGLPYLAMEFVRGGTLADAWN